MPFPCRRLEGHRIGGRRFGAGVPAISQYLLCFFAAQPRFAQPEFGIATEREQLFLAVETVLEPPELGAIGADEQIKTCAVGQFVIAVADAGVADLKFLESHGVSPAWMQE
jgi:hypothetical protein